jgi:hypothetical protein
VEFGPEARSASDRPSGYIHGYYGIH